jgi:LysR family nod box-dependent transcriptional activator
MVDTRVLRGINLNRLPVLWELLRCRNVSIAAENLGLTQSTVSAALKDLREIFDDELLVQSGREFVLSERALELLPVLETTLNLAQELVSEPDFLPATDRSIFRVATADYVSTLFLPEILRIFDEAAPAMTVHVYRPNKKSLSDLQLGLIDMIIGPEQMLDWADVRNQDHGMRFEKCFEDSFVGIVRQGAATPTTKDAYLSAAHATLYLQRELPASLEYDTLIAQRASQFNRVLVPEFWMLPYIVSQTDLVSLVPKSIAGLFQSLFNIRAFDPPIEFPALNLYLVWRRGKEKEPRFAWFLKQMHSAFPSFHAKKAST